VATVPSALALPVEWWRTREVLIFDEQHHGASDTWHAINQRSDHIFYRYGFTGTYFRSGEDELALHALIGDVVAQISLEELVREGYLAEPRVLWLRHTRGKSPDLASANFESLYRKGIVEWEPRNAAVINAVQALQSRGDATIVLTRRRAHADQLGKRISDAVVVKGGEGPQTTNAIRDFLAGRYSVLIGTTVIGEGVDLPRASALVYAAGGNGGVQMVQSYFRPLTAHGDKRIGRIYDFWDNHAELLRRHSQDRMDFARQQLGAGRVISVQ
jgi:superfamily II DNA or RNA helicase